MENLIPLAIFLGIGLGLIQLAVRWLPPADREWMRALLVVALLLRLTVATTFVMFPSVRVFHEDADGQEFTGMLIASMWKGDYPPFPMADVPNVGFLYLAGGLYYVFGRFQPVLSYFNCIIGSLLVLLVYRLAVRFFHPAVGRLTAILVGLVPSMILWSSVGLKDVLVTTCLVIALTSCVSLKERVSPTAVAGILLPSLVILSVRFYMVYFLGFAIAASLIIERGSRFLTGFYKQLFLAVTVAGLFAILGLSDSGEQHMKYFSLEAASSYRRGMAISANSGFDAEVDVSTPENALAYLPVGIAHLLWAPFPWQMVSLRPLLAAPETIMWWFLFPSTMRGILLAIRRSFSSTSALLIFSATLTCAYSLIHGNIGSAFRQRAQILVFLFIFCSAGLYMKRLKKVGMNPEGVLNRAPLPDVTTEVIPLTPTATTTKQVPQA